MIVLIYLVGFFVTFLVTYHYTRTHFNIGNEYDVEQIGLSALLFSVWWPLSIPIGVLLWGLPKVLVAIDNAIYGGRK
jgi:hypothetical protein